MKKVIGLLSTTFFFEKSRKVLTFFEIAVILLKS